MQENIYTLNDNFDTKDFLKENEIIQKLNNVESNKNKYDSLNQISKEKEYFGLLKVK